jgi:hypothetical protein
MGVCQLMLIMISIALLFCDESILTGTVFGGKKVESIEILVFLRKKLNFCYNWFNRKANTAITAIWRFIKDSKGHLRAMEAYPNPFPYGAFRGAQPMACGQFGPTESTTLTLTLTG